ncbi:MAG: lytic transglycosylase domain-containing protein [Syntrophales bacterium]|nr:lytic transglycosylase domain-containing protein [Syntrophales bacterium]
MSGDECPLNKGDVIENQDRPVIPESYSTQSYSGIVHGTALKHGLDPNLISAIIESESEGNALAVSPKGAKGLMQLMPVICRQYGVLDPFDAEENIIAGTAHLAYLLNRLNGNIEHALAAYHCGLMRVLKCKGIPPVAETKNFTRRTLEYYRVTTTTMQRPPVVMPHI